MAVEVRNTNADPLRTKRSSRAAVLNLQTEAGATATVNGATQTVVSVENIAAAILARVRLTAVNAGSPTLDADVEDSWDGTNWNTLVSFAQLTAAGEETLALSRVPGPFVRGRGVIAGTTPDIDFQIDMIGIETS